MPSCRRFLAAALLSFVAIAVAEPVAATAATPSGAPSKPAASSSAPSNGGPPAPAGNAAAFGIQPASATGVDARSRFNFNGNSGATYFDHVALVNIGTAPLTVQFYAADAVSSSDGNFALANADAKSADVGSWIKINGPAQVTLPPRIESGPKKGPSVTIFPFTLKVPANAASGDHAGGLIVSLRTTAAPTDNRVRQNLDQRVGARVYVRVTGPVNPGLSVENLHTSFGLDGSVANPLGSGTMALSYRVRNTGNVILGAEQSASVSSWLGGGAKVTGLAAVPELLPGSSVVVMAKAKGVYPGIRVTAKVNLKPVVPTGAIDPGVRASSASASVWAMPWSLLMIVLILLFGLGYLAWRRWGPRRPRGGRHTPEPKRVTPEPISVG